MNLTFKLALVFFLLLTLSCKERHLFSDQSELAKSPPPRGPVPDIYNLIDYRRT